MRHAPSRYFCSLLEPSDWFDRSDASGPLAALDCWDTTESSSGGGATDSSRPSAIDSSSFLGCPGYSGVETFPYQVWQVSGTQVSKRIEMSNVGLTSFVVGRSNSLALARFSGGYSMISGGGRSRRLSDILSLIQLRLSRSGANNTDRVRYSSDELLLLFILPTDV